jgi:hypothetical protein
MNNNKDYAEMQCFQLPYPVKKFLNLQQNFNI